MNEDFAFDIRRTIVEQIGRGNIFSISGGRIIGVTDPDDRIGIELPVSHGYKVRVFYDEAGDDYIVVRVMVRGAKEFVKGTKTGVYCDQVGEQAYRAGMFRSFSEEEW